MSVTQFKLTIRAPGTVRRARARKPRNVRASSLAPRTTATVEHSGEIASNVPSPPEYTRLSVDDEVDELFHTANAICARIRLRNKSPIEDDTSTLGESVMQLVRRCAILCRGRGVELACMRQTLREEQVDVEIAAHRIVERQRMLRARGCDEDAQILADAIGSARRIEAQLAHLHPHVLFSTPSAIYINTDIQEIAARLPQ